jgi:hypothetical protein
MTRDEMRIVSAPAACLHNAHALSRLLEEEHMADGRIPRIYHDALQIVIANGDQVGAKIFARRHILRGLFLRAKIAWN